MKKFVFILFLLISNSAAYANGPGDYLQKALIGGKATSKIFRASVDCKSIELSGENFQATIPVDSVNTIVYFNEAVGFACINGGGCIKTTNDQSLNDITVFELVAPGLKDSIAKAFKLHQKSCGGPVKRPY